MRYDRSARIAGRKLQTIRTRWFSRHPLCCMCQAAGRVREATELDHVTPLFKGGRDDDGNRQGLCHDCHETKTATDMGYVQRVAVGLDGWPAT